MELDIVKTFEEVGEKHKGKTKLPELQAELRDRTETDAKIWAALGDEDPDTTAAKSIIDNNKRREELAVIIEAKSELAGIRDGAAARMKELNAPTGRLGTPGVGTGEMSREEHKSLGEIFMESEEVERWFKQIAPNGSVPDSLSINSPGVGYQKSLIMMAKALITGSSDTSAGAFVRPYYDTDVALPKRPLTALDTIRVQPVGSDVVDYARMVSRTNNAAIVPEATTGDQPETYNTYLAAHGLKPESALVFEKASAIIETIATFIPSSRRALADAPQIQGIINDELMDMVRQQLSTEVIAGPGGADHLTGVLATSGLTAQAYDSGTPYPILRTLRKAQTKARITGRAVPNAYWLNPTDWETIDLITDGEDRYLFGGPGAMGDPQLWGLPVIQDEGVTQGWGLVGDFTTVVLYDREQANIRISDGYLDYFRRNLVAILAEIRAGLGVKRPAAIVKADLTA